MVHCIIFYICLLFWFNEHVWLLNVNPCSQGFTTNLNLWDLNGLKCVHVSLLINLENRVVPFPFIYVGTSIVYPSVLEIFDNCNRPSPMIIVQLALSNCLNLPCSYKFVIYSSGKCVYTNSGLLHQWQIDKVHVDSSSHFIVLLFWFLIKLCTMLFTLLFYVCWTMWRNKDYSLLVCVCLNV